MTTLSPNDFCRWLQGVMDMRVPGDGLPLATANKIEAKLNEVFEHVVEPSNPPFNDPRQAIIKC